MKRILLDEDVPRRLARTLRDLGLDATAFPNDWKQLPDKRLIEIAEASGFEVLISGDKSMPFQQSIAARGLAVLVLATMDGRTVLSLAPAIATHIVRLVPGRFFLMTRDGKLVEGAGGFP